MIAPYISTRVEQCHYGTRVWIDARKIWAFVGVATVAGERESVEIVGATVLPRDDMLDVERNKRCRLLRHAAILARIAGAVSDHLS